MPGGMGRVGWRYLGLWRGGRGVRGAMWDLVVDLDEDRSLFDRIALKQELEDFLGRRVDVVNRRSLDPVVREQILRDRVEL